MLKVHQYRELNSEDIQGVFEKMIHLVSIVFDLDPLDVQEWKGKKLIDEHSKAQLLARLSDRYSQKITIEQTPLQLVDFRFLTLGQFINLEEYVNEGFNINIHKIAASIYLHTEGGGMFDPITECYSKVNVDYRANAIDDLPINTILGACKGYLIFRDEFFNSYEIFKDPFEGIVVEELNEEEREVYDQEVKAQETQGNQWQYILNLLTQNDATKFDEALKLNLFLAFNQITFLKREMK
jgi:hypothetical protein